MEKYTEYKDSGEKWLGKIPSHWKINKFKYNGLFQKGKIPESTNNNNIGAPIIGASEMNGNFPSTYSNDTTIPQCSKNDILILWDGANAGLVANNLEGIVSSTIIKYQIVKSNIDPNYAYFQLKNLEPFFREKVGGTTIPHMSYDYINISPFLLPPLNEQKGISIYLNSQISQIDKAIAQQQKMIDLLNERKQIIINDAVTKGLDPNVEMKDSGIDWIGRIPRHWNLIKLKYILHCFGRIGFRGYNTSDLVDAGNGAISISPSNMKDGIMDYTKCTYLSWKKYYESPEIIVNNGDILFVKTGSTYGKSSIVSNLPLESTINPQLVIFKQIKCNNKYLSYLLKTNIIKQQVETSVIGGTIPTLSQEKILNYLIPMPNLKEQNDIANKINELILPINKEIDNLNNIISLLQERKQIIINEVVTGKVKVS